MIKSASTPQRKENPSLKAVKFKLAVRVVLIPSRNEYKNNGLTTILWWARSDYILFKQSALRDLDDFMKSKGISSPRVAKKMLYGINNEINSEDDEDVEKTKNDFETSLIKDSVEKLQEFNRLQKAKLEEKNKKFRDNDDNNEDNNKDGDEDDDDEKNRTNKNCFSWPLSPVNELCP
jgi:hypothetical protein